MPIFPLALGKLCPRVSQPTPQDKGGQRYGPQPEKWARTQEAHKALQGKASGLAGRTECEAQGRHIP